MKVIGWLGVLCVLVISSFGGKIIGHSAGMAFAQASPQKQRFYAISKARSQRTGHQIVTIVLTDSQNDCEPLLAGRRDAARRPSNPMTIESQECTSNIGDDWLPAFQNKPVAGAYDASYTNIVWPTRDLFFDLDPRIPSKEICVALVGLYKAIDSNARCIPPAKQ